MTRPPIRSLIYLVAITALLVPLSMGVRGLSIEDVSFGVHATARVAFAFFLAVYFARPLRQLVGLRWLLRFRRTLGLCVALCLTVHFGFLVAFFSISDESVFDDLPRLVTGGFGVLSLYAMAVTSNGASVRALGPWWIRIHRFGIHYLWFFFFVSYLLAVQKEAGTTGSSGPLFAIFLVTMVLGLACRSLIWARRRTVQARRAAAGAG